MTLTTSSNNKNFTKLLKWAFLRNKSIMIIFSVIMAVGIIINLYILTRLSVNYDKPGFEKTCGNIGYFSIILAQTLSILFSIASVSQTFSFLHNKRSTDMFGAIPATRSTLYFSHLLGGAASIALPFIAGSLIICLASCRSFEFVLLNFLAILFGLISIAAVYSFSSLIAYCCGTARDMGLITFAANAIYIGVLAISWTVVTLMIPGLDFESILYAPVLTLFCPMGFAYFLDIYYYGGQTAAFVVTIIWSVLFTAAAVLLGNIAAKTRRMETAQNEFNIKWVPVVIKVGMSVLIGGFAGLITATSFASGFSTMYVFTFWYILAGFAAFIILHLIFSKGIKGKFLSSLFAYIGTTAAAIILLFVMSTGAGIDTYIPMQSNISSVTFGEQNYTYSEPENIQTVTEIHKIITDGLKKESGNQYYIGSSTNQGQWTREIDESDYDKYSTILNTPFNFRYNKNFGFTTTRNYNINLYNLSFYDSQRMTELLLKLYNSDEYKKQNKAFLFSETSHSEDSVQLAYYEYNGRLTYDYEYYNGTEDYTASDTVELKKDRAFLDGLYAVMREDILADPDFFYENTNRYYYGTYRYFGDYFLNLSVYSSAGNTDTGTYDDYLYDVSPSRNLVLSVNLTKNYPRTIAYLEANGYKINNEKLSKGSLL